MKHLLFLITYLVLLCITHNTYALKKNTKSSQHNALQCAAFSPYVDNLNPDFGAHSSKALINELLDKLIKDTPFRCIMTYGVLNGLDAIFSAAEYRHIKVIAIIWIDNDLAVNSQSISKGIEVAKTYPNTIIKLSCGSEVRTRHAYAFDGEIIRCFESLRKAGVTQPITTIDTWWEWCNRSLSCHQNSFGSHTDWIGVNIFPWWENKFSGIHTCTSAELAANFHINRIDELSHTYPNKEIILTEFGWPNGPEGGTEKNIHSGQQCGIANTKNQKKVIESTFHKLAEKNRSGVVFEAFSENWKPKQEGPYGSFWGICLGVKPYACTKKLNIHYDKK